MTLVTSESHDMLEYTLLVVVTAEHQRLEHQRLKISGGSDGAGALVPCAMAYTADVYILGREAKTWCACCCCRAPTTSAMAVKPTAVMPTAAEAAHARRIAAAALQGDFGNLTSWLEVRLLITTRLQGSAFTMALFRLQASADDSVNPVSPCGTTMWLVVHCLNALLPPEDTDKPTDIQLSKSLMKIVGRQASGGGRHNANQRLSNAGQSVHMQC